MIGIDISENNANLDWQAIKDYGTELVVVRAGYGQGHEDSMFYKYAAKATEEGYQLSAYWFSYALTVEQAAAEGYYCRQLIDSSGLGFNDIWFDMEDTAYRQNNGFDYNDVATNTAMCDAFFDSLQLSSVGVYANPDWFTNVIDYGYLRDRYKIWLAEYNSSASFGYDMWQYGIRQIGGVDIDCNIT